MMIEQYRTAQTVRTARQIDVAAYWAARQAHGATMLHQANPIN